jgi:hypothetical protein
MCLKARGDHLRSILRVLATLWEMPKEYSRPFQQPLPSSRYTLGNAQIEVETRWADFPACLQPIGSKDTPSAYCSAYLCIYQTCSADFKEEQRFFLT